ncbi:MAG: hypothetical protein UY56_C0014G0005 [Parcubacteria group bacterium GW2011_GWA1_50_14]|uniref:Uncharacterized protein n=1 Tax=Candidatus Liptonbacteria bacterium GWB1_49_6 TaxID=1798644 RepID=A0A1G2C7I7_9BACT|nr:MAG: hypothetical protein UY56_C0014G0005 [Parcubacteria group bacterium GW2011_GWA1_50_14]OGY96729.1 MAG: hypothetical protein A2122_02375 [Candidatus Liptonbacteria bacterium GWB1_49_6]
MEPVVNLRKRLEGEDNSGSVAPMDKWFGMRFIVSALFILVVLFAAGVFSRDFPKVDKNKWQAVFLNNNQVYFGHIKNEEGGYIALTNIFYLRAAEPLQQGSQGEPQLSLVKLGSELHGPEDMMHIPKNVILFWEDLKDDSQVVQTIKGAAVSPQQ